jgi:hypothetical protein
VTFGQRVAAVRRGAAALKAAGADDPPASQSGAVLPGPLSEERGTSGKAEQAGK